MEFNANEMKVVASSTSATFSKEGLLFIKEKSDRKGKKPREFVGRWFRLKGNILYYLRGRERFSEPRGLVILERCSVELDSNEDKNYYCFLIVFEHSEPVRLAALSEHEREDWVRRLHTASYECMKMQLQSLREVLRSRTGGDMPPSGLDGSGSSAADPESEEPWIEMCISCDRLPKRLCGVAPNVVAEVFCLTPPHVSWTKVAQTEIVERTCNPCFMKTVSLSEQRAHPKTVIKIVLHDVVERLTDTRTFIGQAVCTPLELTGGQDGSRVRLEIITPDSSDGGHVTLMAWADARDINAQTRGLAKSRLTVVNSPMGAVAATSAPKAVSRTSSSRMERTKKRDQLKPLFANIISKSFRFPTISDSETLDVSEFLGESKLTFTFAVEWLKFMLLDARTWSEQLNQLGTLCGEWEKLRQQALDKSEMLQTYYANSINSLEECFVSIGCTFKPSRNKSAKDVELIPINLHLHRMLVKNCQTEKGSFYDVVTVGAFTAHTMKFKNGGLLRQIIQHCPLCQSSAGRDGSSTSSHLAAAEASRHVTGNEPTWHYHRLSSAVTQHRVPEIASLVGAQASVLKRAVLNCDWLSSECRSAASLDGGEAAAARQAAIMELEYQCSELLKIADHPLVAEGLECLRTKLPEARHADLSTAHLMSAMEDVTKSAANVCAECRKVFVECSSSRNKSADSLLDCMGGLTPNLEDLKAYLTRLCKDVEAALTFLMLYDLRDTAAFGNDEVALRHDVVSCQAIVAATTGVLAKVRVHATDGVLLRRVALAGMLLEFESLLSCHRDEAGMLEDFVVGVKGLSSVKFRCVENLSGVDDYAVYCPRFEGNRYEMVVLLPLPSVVYHLLPEELQNGRPFGVVPILFNIGINEVASVAERFGDVRLQEELNKTSCNHLREYSERCTDILSLLPVSSSKSEKVDHTLLNYSESLPELLSRLSQQVTSQKSKNVEVLHLASEITRRLGGVRFTSCKSAKDRTAMAVTLEEVQILQSNESLAPHMVARALECLRSEGVRRQNTFKNSGSLKYAFNSLQLQSFPKAYRPPNGTYGSGES